MKLRIRTTIVGRTLACIIGLLVSASLLFQLGRMELGWGQSHGLKGLFDLGRESNIPTYFSSMVLLLAAALLFLVAKHKSREGDSYRAHWFGLATGFLLMSVDEIAMLHENMYRIPKMLGLEAPEAAVSLYWLLPYMLVFALLAIPYTGFVRHLDSRTRRLFVTAGLLYVSGALGMEVVGDFVWAATDQSPTWTKVLATTTEESLEMTGAALFVVALVRYLGQAKDEFVIAFSDGAETGSHLSER